MTQTNSLTRVGPEPNQSTPRFNWMMGLGVLVAAGLILTAVLRILTPPPTQKVIPTPRLTQTNFDLSHSRFSNVIYSGPNFTPPETLPALAATTDTKTSQLITAQLINKYQLLPHPKSANVWTNGRYSLVKTPTKDTYKFSEDLSALFISAQKTPQVHTPLDMAAFLLKANSVIAELELETRFQLFEFGIEYYQTDGQHLEKTPWLDSKTSHVLIPFIQKFQAWPILSDGQKQNQLSFLFTFDGQLSDFTFPIHGVEITSSETPLVPLSLDAAIFQINSGLGTIIDATSETFVPFSIVDITQANFKTVSLEYRVDSQTQQALPFYRFEGLITNADGQTYQATIITPAVATTPSSSVQ